MKKEGEHTVKLAMLVDDNSIDNFVNSRMIEAYMFAEEMLIFKKSVKAYAYLEQIKLDESIRIPDVIFLDMNMPVMDGYEFLEEFDRLPLFIRNKSQIVILSGHIDQSRMVVLRHKHPNLIDGFEKPLIKSNLKRIEESLKEIIPLAG